MSDQEQDASFLERIVTQVVGLATRSEIPDPVTRSLASHLASAVEKSAAALGAHDADSVLETVVNMNVGGSPGQLAFARMIVDAAGLNWPAFRNETAAPEQPENVGDGNIGAAELDEAQRRLDEIYGDVAAPFEELDAFEEDVEQTSTAPIPTFSRWRIEKVRNILARLLAISRAWDEGDPERAMKYPHRVRFEDALSTEIEFFELDRRHRLAAELARQAMANPDFKSPGHRAGNAVHSVLQERYQMARAADNVIIQEWWVYFPGARRRRTITEQSKREHREKDPTKKDYTFTVVEKARLPKRGRLSSKERWDTLDLTATGLWEIKPLFSLEEAVLQESYYRFKYAYCALPFLDPEVNVRVRVPWIEPGGVFPVKDPYSGELLITTSMGDVAVPIGVRPTLPGLVPYVLLRKTTETDMVRLLLRVQAWLRSAYAELKRRAQELRGKILIALLITILIVIVVIIVMAVLAKSLAEAVQPSPPGQLPPPSEEPVPPMGRERKRAAVGNSFIGVAPATEGGSLRVSLQTNGPPVETIPFSIGPVTLEGVPLARFGDVLTAIINGLDGALSHLAGLPAGRMS